MKEPSVFLKETFSSWSPNNGGYLQDTAPVGNNTHSAQQIQNNCILNMIAIHRSTLKAVLHALTTMKQFVKVL